MNFFALRWQRVVPPFELQDGWSPPCGIITNACASGANAIGHAFHLVKRGQVERALCGGYDAAEPHGLCGIRFAAGVDHGGCRAQFLSDGRLATGSRSGRGPPCWRSNRWTWLRRGARRFGSDTSATEPRPTIAPPNAAAPAGRCGTAQHGGGVPRGWHPRGARGLRQLAWHRDTAQRHRGRAGDPALGRCRRRGGGRVRRRRRLGIC